MTLQTFPISVGRHEMHSRKYRCNVKLMFRWITSCSFSWRAAQIWTPVSSKDTRSRKIRWIPALNVPITFLWSHFLCSVVTQWNLITVLHSFRLCDSDGPERQPAEISKIPAGKVCQQHDILIPFCNVPRTYDCSLFTNISPHCSGVFVIPVALRLQ